MSDDHTSESPPSATSEGFQNHTTSAEFTCDAHVLEDPHPSHHQSLVNAMVAEYLGHGLQLCPIEPGSKGPNTSGWNKPENAITQPDQFPPGMGVGLLHSFSGTMALDVDSFDHAEMLLACNGINLQALMNAPDAVQVISGRAGHGKLIYKMPPGVVLPSKQVKLIGVAFEMRCATANGLSVQDILPPTIHPDTRQPYTWGGAGDWRALPTIPEALLRVWEGLVAKDAKRIIHTGAPISANWQEVQGALEYISPDCTHDEWRDVGFALHFSGTQTNQLEEAFHLWHEWSAKATIKGKYLGESYMRGRWNTFVTTKDSSITLGTLMRLAKENGWERPPIDVSGLFGPVSGSVATPHPLAQFVTCNTQPVATRWTIPGFIGHGVVIFAGQHGVGKTTGLLPLAMVAAGLHASGDPLAPTHWRHVIYITEDVEQARRILTGIVLHGDLGIDADTVADRLHIVEARRLTPGYVVQVGATYREQFTRTVDGVEVLPLVVIDTKSAVLALEEENSNSEASAAMAALKQAFAGLPVWVVGHVAKSNMTRTDVEGLSMRGGSAFEADANQVLYLVKEGEVRYLVRGKTRFEARWSELQIEAHCADVVAVNEFGSMESVTLRWGIARPATKGRKEAAKQAQEREHRESALAVQREVLDAVQGACDMGNPLNRAGVKTQVPRKREIVYSAIETLLNDFRLYEVVVPVEERTHHKRSAFLVRLTDAERDAAMKNGTVPVRIHTVPQTWSRLPNSSVPRNFTTATNM
jgi:hypothetical protein